AANLADHLRRHPEGPLADVAFTLARGRRAFAQRRVLVCRTPDEAARALDGGRSNGEAGEGEPRAFTSAAPATAPPVAFLFPGQGTQHVNMAAELYRGEPVFRAQVDHCAAILGPLLNLDL